MLQQNWYNEGNRYLKWIFKNKKLVFINLDLVFVLFILTKFIDTKLAMILFTAHYLTKNDKLMKQFKKGILPILSLLLFLFFLIFSNIIR